MGKLYENINALCEERGIKPSKLCADVGISRGLITDLKMGRKTGITAVTAQKIASYFGVSVGYLLGDETEKAPADDGKRIVEESLSKNANILKIARRDGSYIEEHVTDQELDAILAIMRLTRDASGDL